MRGKTWKYLQLAAEEAVKNDDGRHYLLGCIGVRGDGAIVKASNGPTPVPTREMHAEYRVSKKLDYDATVYVARVLRDGSFGKAMPCDSCLKALKTKRVKRVYFTISNDNFGMIPL
jgi:tRNA(Arg) A34 adenosine deaminase TadA